MATVCPRITVLVGAGASAALGLPTTQGVTESLLAGEPGDEEHAPTKELLTALRETADHLKCWGVQPGPTFEHVLHALEAVVTTKRVWRRTRGAIGEGSVYGLVAGGPRSELLPLFEGTLAEQAAGYLLRRLHQIFSAAPSASTATPEWAAYRRFWQALADSHGLDIATTNYDDLIETAVPGLNQGFLPVAGEEVGRFAVHELRRLSNRLIHLHGSIHFGYRDSRSGVNRFAFEDSWHDVYYHERPERALRAWHVLSNPVSQAGEELISGPLISGLHKSEKLLASEPYASYYRAFGRWLEDNSRLLIVGYGFGDLHINALARRLTSWHGGKRRVAVITWLPEREWLMARHNPHARTEEKMAISSWSHDDEIWRDQMFSYRDVWTSENGLCRVYLGGLLDVARRQLDDLVAFLDADGQQAVSATAGAAGPNTDPAA